MGKRNSTKKDKKPQEYRTKEERQQEIKPILHKMMELQLSPQYEEIKRLYQMIQIYINEGRRIEINIPFPMIRKRIIGVLAVNKKEEVWLMLKNEI